MCDRAPGAGLKDDRGALGLGGGGIGAGVFPAKADEARERHDPPPWQVREPPPESHGSSELRDHVHDSGNAVELLGVGGLEILLQRPLGEPPPRMVK